jgi:NADH-quinone oxidoreductase subunit N
MSGTLLLLILVGANNLMSMFFALAGFSLNLYVLVLYDVRAQISREAALKYFYLSALSAGLMLFGIFLIYATTGYVDFSALHTCFLSSRFNGTLLTFALAFLTTGLFFKLSAFPSHL